MLTEENNRQELECEAQGDLQQEPTKQIIYTVFWRAAGAVLCGREQSLRKEGEAERGEVPSSVQVERKAQSPSAMEITVLLSSCGWIHVLPAARALPGGHSHLMDGSAGVSR